MIRIVSLGLVKKFSKQLSLGLLAALFLTLVTTESSTAHNIRNETSKTRELITDFATTLNLTEQGLLVEENIIYYFPENNKRGIERDIPIRDFEQNPDGSRTFYSYHIELIEVTANDKNVNYVHDLNENIIRLRIGDPNKTVTGEINYRIKYLVKGTVTEGLEGPLLSWNSVGTDWSVPIYSNLTIVQADFIDSSTVTCFQGKIDSSRPCENLALEEKLVFFQAGPLGPYEGVTINAFVNYDPDYKTSTDPFFTGSVSGAIGPKADLALNKKNQFSNPLTFLLLIVVVILIIGSFILIFLVLNRGTNYNKWLKTTNIPAVFSVPKNLTPAEMALALTASSNNFPETALAATLFDLSSRKWIKISVEKRLNDTDVLVLTRLQARTRLRSWELELLDGLFANGEVLRLNTTLPNLTTILAKTTASLKIELENKKLWSTEVKKAYSKIAIVQAGGALLIFGGFTLFGDGSPLGLALTLLGVGLTIYALIKYVKGIDVYKKFTLSEFYLECGGFKKTLTTSGALDRAALVSRLGLQSSDLAATFFPYAIIFGVEKQWIDSFKNLDRKELEEKLNIDSEVLHRSNLNIYTIVEKLSVKTLAPQNHRSASSGGYGRSGSRSSGGRAGRGGGGGGGRSW